MINLLNVTFQEEYKRLDKLCADCFSGTEGVSEYIRQMEATPLQDREYAIGFDNDYKQLKHMRWIRNCLAHEVGSMEADICTDDDLDWVKGFYERIRTGTDPLTQIHKAKIKTTHHHQYNQSKIHYEQHQKTQKTQQQQHTSQHSYYIEDDTQPKQSLWSRIVSFIKALFS